MTECPGCGEKLKAINIGGMQMMFECSTIINEDGSIARQGIVCKDNQISQLKAQLKTARRDAFDEVLESLHSLKECSLDDEEVLQNVINGLQTLAEQDGG